MKVSHSNTTKPVGVASSISALSVCILVFKLIMCRNTKRHQPDCTFTNAIYFIVSRKFRVLFFLFFPSLFIPTPIFLFCLVWSWFLLLSPSWMLCFCLDFLDSLGGGCLCYQNSYKWCLGSELKLEAKKSEKCE